VEAGHSATISRVQRGASTVQAVKDAVDELRGDDDVPLFEAREGRG
jgi:hypothetical protein